MAVVEHVLIGLYMRRHRVAPLVKSRMPAMADGTAMSPRKS
jgi:hypothetical protein